MEHVVVLRNIQTGIAILVIPEHEAQFRAAFAAAVKAKEETLQFEGLLIETSKFKEFTNIPVELVAEPISNGPITETSPEPETTAPAKDKMKPGQIKDWTDLNNRIELIESRQEEIVASLNQVITVLPALQEALSQLAHPAH